MRSPARGSCACSSTNTCTMAEVCTCCRPRDVRAAGTPQLTEAPPLPQRLGFKAPGASSPCFAVLSALSVGLPGLELSDPISPEWSIVHGLRPPRGPADGQYHPSPTSWADQTACCFLHVSYHPLSLKREVWLQPRFELIGSTKVKKTQGKTTRRERSFTTIIITLMFIAALSSFALTLWKLVKLKIIKRIR